MLTDLQRKRVWEGWLSGEIRANYFADLSGQYYKRQRWIVWGSLILSSGALAGAVAALGAANPPMHFVAPILALVAAALSYYSLVAKNEKSAADCAELYEHWSELAREYEQLWDDMYADDAPLRLSGLEDRGRKLGAKGIPFPVDEAKLLKWEEYVVRQHAHAPA